MAHLGCVKELHFVPGLLFTFLKDTFVLSHIFKKGLSNLVARSDGSGPFIFLQFQHLFDGHPADVLLPVTFGAESVALLFKYLNLLLVFIFIR
jgi:hypothetical protein